MSKKMLIDATHAEETRVVVVDGNKVEEFDFETVNKRQLAGNIYLAKVTRVEPSLQAAFVDYGGNRHGFLAFAEIHPDYYQIPVADRKALLEEERAFARAQEEEDNRRSRPARSQPSRHRGDDKTVAEAASGATEIGGMEVVDLDVPDAGLDEAQDAALAPTASTMAAAGEVLHDHAHDHAHVHDPDDQEAPFRNIDHASDQDDEIESVAEEDVHEEIAASRKPRARRYKIQEVIKVRQIMLVQVVKEERGNKGAALTTYLSLAGRYCVLMPNTARGGGISRKITNAADRKKLKEIASEMQVPEGAGLIVRTAGAKRTKPEIKRDYEYLMRLWEEIRELTLKSIAPAAIYEEGNLIKRSIRDLYSREIDEILVEGEAGYRTAKDFMKMIMPSHAKVVQLYQDQMPLFARFQVESYLSGMFNPVVQLKSGGYIVIGVTEALVAIDVNSGRATKEGSIEETALKTNLEAAEEVARQLRLRDLAGLIVIDFIDMEERRNNLTVEKRLKDKLKTDRARIQVGRISGFGLLEMSRQRLRPGMLESTTQPCAHCHGTGLIRSDDSLGLQVLRALEEEGTRKRSREVLLRAPVGIVNFLINTKREHLALIEARYGMSVRIEADPTMISPDYAIEKFKTATRVVPEAAPVISGNASLMGAPVAEEDEDIVEDEEIVEEAEEATPAAAAMAAGAADGAGSSKKRRRRRRKKKPGAGGGAPGSAGAQVAGDEDGDDEDGGEDEGPDEGPDEGRDGEVAVEAAPVAATAASPAATAPEAARDALSVTGAVAAPDEPVAEAAGEAVAEVASKAAPRKTVSRARSSTSSRSRAAQARAAEASAEAPVEAQVAVQAEAPVTATPETPAGPVAAAKPRKAPSRSRSSKSKLAPAAELPALVADPGDAVAPTVGIAGGTDPVPDPQDPVVSAIPETAQSGPTGSEPVAEDPDAPPRPKKKGWWSLGR